ncbi:MAG: hypothetical protein NXI08_01950 [bacterium]|nr:hypothetical protein [bacterium]
MTDKLFGSLGLNLPENSDELKKFLELFGDNPIQSDFSSLNPKKILRDSKREIKVVSNVDYHKRTVLAAEIVYQLHQEYTLGHVKLQKLLYLCYHLNEMSLHVSFYKQAMGPYDNRLMRSIDSQFLKNKWFRYDKSQSLKYAPLEFAGGHKEWYLKYFGNQVTNIDTLIDIFRKRKTDFVELVATIYACWLDGIEKQELITDLLIIDKVNNWSKEKRGKFSDDKIVNTKLWMTDKGLTPINY